MSFLKSIFGRRSALAKYEEDVTIKRKKKSEQLFAEITDVDPTDLQLPKPRVQRGDFAYMLVTDNDKDDNDASEEQLIKRGKRPIERLVDRLNRNIGSGKIERLNKWPAKYKRRELCHETNRADDIVIEEAREE